MAVHQLEHAKPVIRRTMAESLLGCVDHEAEHSERMVFGQAFHRFAAAYTLHCKAIGEETAQTEVAELAWDAWANTRGLDQSRFDEFVELCQEFGMNHMAKLDSLLAIETTIAHDIGWAILRCTLDRIDRMDGGDIDDPPTSISILDYKTEWGERNHEFQIRWYAQMAFLHWPSLETVTFDIDWVRWCREPVFIRTFERWELVTWWETTLAGLRAAYFAPKGDPTGGMWCHGCKLRATCAESIASAKEAPDTEEEADILLERSHRHHAAAKVCDDQLEEFYRGRPSRVVRGEEVGWLRPKKPAVKVTGSPHDILMKIHRRGKPRPPLGDLLRPIPPTRKKDIETWVAAGVAEVVLGEPAYKTRAWVEPRANKESNDECQ